MKTTLSILAGITMLMVVTVCNRSSEDMQSYSSNEFGKDIKPNKGSYLASDFAKFKKENLREDLNAAEKVSEKVMFKAFVKQKESHYTK